MKEASTARREALLEQKELTWHGVQAQLAALRDGPGRLSPALLEEIEEELLARRDGLR
jgi:hypothetical protein